MSAYSIVEIQTDVKTILDSNGYSSAISGTGEGEYLNGIIGLAVVPAARYVLMNAPVHMLGDSVETLTVATDVSFDDNKGKKFALPSKLLRFIQGKLSDWKAPVTTLLDEGCTDYAIQSKTGVCANPTRPAGFLTGGGQYIELYGSRLATALTGSISYVAEPALNSSTPANLPLPDTLYQPFLYQTAGMVAAQTQEEKLAENLLSIAKNLMF